jgi:hypothetical protein
MLPKLLMNGKKIKMKHTRIISIIFGMAVLVSACGGGTPATPTIAAADVQSTALAAAFTVVAQTQAAIPTNTAIPPTQTPPPTDTPVLFASATPVTLPSQDASITAAAPTQAVPTGVNSDPCNAPLKSNPLGRPTRIKLENQSGAPVTVSLYLNLTLIGECGYRGYNIGKGGSTTLTDLVQGCYNVGVFVNDIDRPTKSFGYGCINNSDQWTFVIAREKVTLQGR